MDICQHNDELYSLIDHPLDRAMFILFYHWGLTYKEIAYCFNTSEEEVIQQLNALKDLIERQYV